MGPSPVHRAVVSMSRATLLLPERKINNLFVGLCVYMCTNATNSNLN